MRTIAPQIVKCSPQWIDIPGRVLKATGQIRIFSEYQLYLEANKANNLKLFKQNVSMETLYNIE